MSEIQEAGAVLIPLVVFILGVFSLRAWRRDRRTAQLVGGAAAVVYGLLTILNLSLMGNACGDFLFADIGYGPRSAAVDVAGKACLLLAMLTWGVDAVRAPAKDMATP